MHPPSGGPAVTVAELDVAKPEKADLRLYKPVIYNALLFDMVNNHFWHRYMLPFGCYFYTEVSTDATQHGWRDWKAGLHSVSGGRLYISPFSVTYADLLNMAVSAPYMLRFKEFITSLLYILQREGDGGSCNILRYHRRRGYNTDISFRRFVTMERYLHLLGSVYLMNRACMENNDENMGVGTENELNSLQSHWNTLLSVLKLSEVKKEIECRLSGTRVKKQTRAPCIRTSSSCGRSRTRRTCCRPSRTPNSTNRISSAERPELASWSAFPRWRPSPSTCCAAPVGG